MRLLLVALGVLVCAGSAAAQESGCAKDTDCKGARTCQNRGCVDPPAVVACGHDLDCPGDDICVDKKCSPPGAAKKKKGAGTAPAAAAPASSPGGALLLQSTLPLASWLGVHAQLAWHFLSKDFALVTVSAGVTFGN